MNNARINNEIDLTYPDGFKDMNEEALTRYFGTPANRWGVYDDVNHMILSVSWEKVGFKRKFTDAESFLIGVENRLSRKLLNYQRITTYKTKFGKKLKGSAIRFEYRVNAARIVQVCDLVAFKYKGKFYSVWFITGKTNAAAGLTAFGELLKTVTPN